MGERNSQRKLGVSRGYDQIKTMVFVMGREVD